jgi:hypothetical protein
MEIALRMTFCALAGGRYAALVAGGQETHWLLENCEVIAQHHEELSPERRTAVLAALQACRRANRDRNRLVHDAWGTGPGGGQVALHSSRRSYPITGRAWATADIRAVAEAIGQAQRNLLTAIEDALGPQSLTPVPPRDRDHGAQDHGAQNHGPQNHGA